MSDIYTQMIRNTRLRIGQPPRNFDRKEMAYLRLKPPAWCRPGMDELHSQYQDLALLLTHGQIVWGALVMANSQLASPGSDDAAGVVVYCKQPHWYDDLLRLSEFAKQVGELKDGSGRSPKEKEMGRWIADERTRFLNHPVPKSIVGDAPIYTSVIVFARKHLPSGILSTPYFPLLIHEQTKAVMVAPARYWDRELVHAWLRDV